MRYYANRDVLRNQLGDIDGAIIDYNLAIKVNPGYAIAYYNRANVFMAKGDLESAITDFSNAIAIEVSLTKRYCLAWGYHFCPDNALD